MKDQNKLSSKFEGNPERDRVTRKRVRSIFIARILERSTKMEIGT